MAKKKANPPITSQTTSKAEPFWKPYQLRYLADQAPRKCVNKSRRVGFSEVVSFEDATRALGLQIVVDDRGMRFADKLVRPVSQNLLSASRAQSQELLKRVGKWVEKISTQVFGKSAIKRQTALKIELHDGTECLALPSNPRSVRGGEGDITLDEFASVIDQPGLWKASEPMAKPNLGNQAGYRVRVISTPLGDDNLFYEFCRGNQAGTFSQHEVTVHDAAREGFPILVSDGLGGLVPGTTEQLRAEYGDDEFFAQEFECSFMSASMRYIPMQVYADACYDLPWPAALNDVGVPHFGGLDLARHHDRTAFVRLAKAEGVNWHIGTETIKGLPWDQQEQWWDGHFKGCSQVCFDATAMGSGPADRIVSRWGSLAEAVVFGNSVKEELATNLKLALARRKLRPRADDIELRREVLSLRREILQSGMNRYDAPRTGGGHGDRAWALALAQRASGAVSAENTPRIHTDARSARRHWGVSFARQSFKKLWGS